MTADYKAGKLVHIAKLYLEDSDYFEAEKYLQRASAIISDVKDLITILTHKASFARVYEYKRKFFEAGSRYYELSFRLTDPAQAREALDSAIICAVLAPAGPQRSRQLALLYKDERVSELPLFPTLERMFMNRMLRTSETSFFASQLVDRPGQESGDNTALTQAIREHNLLSASKVYLNVSFTELGVLLDVSATVAEKIASTMIAENRLIGHIDQSACLIHFHERDSLQLWDSRIEATCSVVNGIVDQISSSYPSFVEEAVKLHYV